jgi:hypothetical protein
MKISDVIKDLKDNDVFHKTDVNNFEPITRIRFDTRFQDSTEVLHITFCVDLSKISVNNTVPERMLNYTPYDGDDITCEDVPLSIFEYFGPNKHFRVIFSEIEEATTLTKKEISNLLRHESICDLEPKYDIAHFNLSIPKSRIKNSH